MHNLPQGDPVFSEPTSLASKGLSLKTHVLQTTIKKTSREILEVSRDLRISTNVILRKNTVKITSNTPFISSNVSQTSQLRPEFRPWYPNEENHKPMWETKEIHYSSSSEDE
ncbi:hypothetical protein PIB30_024826 [Stylosanthes scabra]|uniref:Uncharacterized protein n=1 Tax=Stylosanthes scabra TaxID=79078 RepID=A0ABU6YAD6_9FABA|nr:hypothetical protein [Stylosanthes scabra]